MKQLIILFFTIFATFSITLCVVNLTMNNKPPIKQEYTIELVNQDTIKIYSHLSNKLYITTYDKTINVFLDDNL